MSGSSIADSAAGNGAMVDQKSEGILDPFRDGPWVPPPGQEPADTASWQCPNCGSEYARPVVYVFTFNLLRSFFLPWLMNLYKCQECGERFSLPGPRLRRFMVLIVPLLVIVVVVLLAALMSAFSG